MKIQIGCLGYDIREIDKELADASKIYANIDHTTQIISLQKGLTPERYKESLLHEVLHGVINQWLPDCKGEEKIVTAVCYGLLCVLKANPKLKDILF